MDLEVQEDKNNPDTLTFKRHAERTFRKCRDVLVAKRKAYGTDNITEQGIRGVLNRVQHDKLSRLSNIVENADMRDVLLSKYGVDSDVVDKHIPQLDTFDESARDTLIDVVNYTVIMLALLDGWWDVKDPPKKKKKKKKTKKKHKRTRRSPTCGNCGEFGHNSRSCKV